MGTPRGHLYPAGHELQVPGPQIHLLLLHWTSLPVLPYTGLLYIDDDATAGSAPGSHWMHPQPMLKVKTPLPFSPQFVHWDI